MKLTIILLLLISISLSAQIDSMKVNTLYIDLKPRVEQFIDSINVINGYPRQGAETYIQAEYDSILLKHSITLNKVTEKYIKHAVLNAIGLPTIKIPIDSLTVNARIKLESEIISNNWNTYIKNDNIWLFNYNQNADDTFTQNQRDYIVSIGGEIYNFD